MTEKDLIRLGFVVKEFNNGPDIEYYYTLDICDSITLISCDSLDAKRGKWTVELVDSEEVLFKKIEELEPFMNSVAIGKKNKEKERK